MTMYPVSTFGAFLLALITVAGCAGNGDTTNSNESTRERGEATVEVGASQDAVSAIRSVMNAQVDAWNRGSIEEFMEGYARTDTLRFASGGDVWRGWEGTLRRYRESYQDEGLMGSLSFRDIDVWSLSDEHALVFGRWELERSEMYANVGGLFTLVFERSPEGWRIVHDHTSSGQSSESEQQNSVND